MDEQRGTGDGDESTADSLKTLCATHPKTETRLRCGKCGRPICPKCLVYTPVGTRCRICANLKPLPMFQLQSAHYVQALAMAVALIVVGGFLWAIVSRATPFLSFWIVLLMGYLVGEALSRATNRKRGRPLQVIAGVTLLLAYAARGFFLVLITIPGVLLTAGMAIDLALQQLGALLSNPIGLLFFALSIYIAATRL